MTSQMPVRLALVALLTGTPDAVADQSDSLATPESFASIADEATRSAALFTELGKVLTHPRCVNCHPAGDRTGRRRSWPAGHALFQLPPAGQLGPRPGAWTPGVASRTA